MLHVGPLNQSDLGVKLPSAEWILEGQCFERTKILQLRHQVDLF